MPVKPSLLIIGGGIVALTIALEAANSSMFSSITVAEKESLFGTHASTRNSGVIHSGFYYEPSSDKAKYCSEGNQLMRSYCIANNLPLLKCGKVVVSSSQCEDNLLHELYRRGRLNGSEVYLYDKARLIDYEPRALTYNNFLWSPNTWSASPYAVLQCLLFELREKSVHLLTNHKFIDSKNSVAIFDNGERVNYDILVNAAGGHALSVSQLLGLESNFSLLPFKGLYLKSKVPTTLFKTHIYPVPDIDQPFLGVHTTLTHDGYLKLGPTALPAFSPENYSGLDKIDLSKLPALLSLQISLFLKNTFGFRRLALREFQYLFKSRLIEDAQNLTSSHLNVRDFDWYSPGIRAQLYDRVTQELCTDFHLAQNDCNFHLLNSISPAWTCSFRTAKSVLKSLSEYI